VSDQAERTWTGDWSQRIVHRTQALGYASLTELSERYPAMTFEGLANLVGDDIAPVQVEQILRAEALEAGTFGCFARDALVRYLREYLPAGWLVGDRVDARTAQAFGAWSTAVGEQFDPLTEAAWVELKATVPPMGWLPDGPNDPHLLKAFSSVNLDSAAYA